MAVSPVQIVGLLTVIESPEPIVIDAVVELVHVPFAPVIKTRASVGATFSISNLIWFIASLSPIIS